MKDFFDEEKTTAVPKEKDVQACEVSSCMKRDFTSKQYIIMLGTMLPAVVFGGIGLFRYASWAPAVWVLSLGGYFTYLAIRLVGSREEKIDSLRLRSLSEAKKAVLFFGMVVNALLPAFFMILAQDDLFLVLYTLCLIVGMAVPSSYLCRCMGECRGNRKDEE